MDDNIIDKLNKGKQPIFCDDAELQYIKKPIGKSHYKNAIEEIKEDLQDKYIICDICGKKYTKYNKTKHCKTNHHQFCLKLNKKWRKMILD